MARVLAGLVVLVFALGFLTPPAASGDGLAGAVQLPAPLKALPGLAPQPGAQDQEQAPPDDAGILAAEKARPTRTVTMYGHVFDTSMNAPMPANTIYPTGDANLGLGLFDWCGDGFAFQGIPPQPSPWTNCDKDANSKIALFLTAGPVQVHSPEEFAYDRLHNERGRTKDVVLDTAGEIKAWLWMSLDYHAWSVGNGNDDTFCIAGLPPDVGCPYPYWGWDPAIWPAWVVEAKLYMVELGEYGQGASEPPPILEAWNSDSMTLIAEGATTPEDVTNGLPGNPNVHEFEVNLGAPLVDVIPKTHDVVLVYNFYSVINGQKVSGHTWRVWAGELFPAKFTLPVKNALDVEFVIPQFVHDKVLVHSVISSAFGSYDVHVPTAKLTVTGPGNQPVEPVHITRVGDYQVAHGAHFKPVNITWIWDYKADNLAPGTYKTTVESCNVQGSACEVTEGAFTINADRNPAGVIVGRSGQRTISDAQLQAITQTGTSPTPGPQAGAGDAPAPTGPRPVPGPEGFLLLAGAGAAALVLRRRWGP